MKKKIIAIAVALGALFAFSAVAATLQGYQGGTGYATSTAGNNGKCLQQSSSSPFLTWTIGTCGSGGGSTTTIAGAANASNTFNLAIATGTIGIATSTSGNSSTIAITVPGNLSAFTNDPGYITTSTVGPSTSTYLAVFNASGTVAGYISLTYNSSTGVFSAPTGTFTSGLSVGTTTNIYPLTVSGKGVFSIDPTISSARGIQILPVVTGNTWQEIQGWGNSFGLALYGLTTSNGTKSNGIQIGAGAGSSTGGISFLTAPDGTGGTVRGFFNSTGSLAISDGTNSASSLGLYFKDDTDTGFYRPGANELSFVVAGSEKLNVVAQGLKQNGTGSAASPNIFWNGDTNTGIYSDAADNLGFSTSGTARLYIASSGNISIGTTTPANKFSVAGYADVQGLAVGTTTTSTATLNVVGTSNHTQTSTFGANVILTVTSTVLATDSTGKIIATTTSGGSSTSTYSILFPTSTRAITQLNTLYAVSSTALTTSTFESQPGILFTGAATSTGHQPIGTGYTNMVIKVGITNGSGSDNTSSTVQLQECTDGTYSSCSNVATTGSFNWQYLSAGGASTTATFSTPYTMLASKYYQLFLTSSASVRSQCGNTSAATPTAVADADNCSGAARAWNFYLTDQTGGPVTLTLPLSSTTTQGAWLAFKDRTGAASSTNAITIQATSTNLIDGTSTYLMTTRYGSIKLVNDALGNWMTSY